MSSSKDSDQPVLSSATPRPSKIRWLIFVLACGTSFFLYLHRYTWNIIGPKIQEEFMLSEIQTGALGGFFNWTYGPGQIPSGMLCDYIGPHLFLGIIIVLWSLALPCLGLMGNYSSLAGMRFLFGATQAGAYPSLAKVSRTWFPAESRTIMQGWIATFFGRGGGFLSPIILGTVLIGVLGLSWRAALIVLSGTGLMFGVAFLILFRNSPKSDPRVNDAERDLILDDQDRDAVDTRNVLPWSKAMKNRNMWFFVIQQFNNAGADGFYSLFLGSYFLKTHGLATEEAAVLIGMPLLGGSVGGMVGAYCNDILIRRTGNRRWSRTTVGFWGKALAGVLMFVAIAQSNPVAAGLAFFVVKFFSDWSQPTVWGTCTDLGGRYSATVFSIINTAGSIAGITLPPLFGAILDRCQTTRIFDGVETTVPDFAPLLTVVAIMYFVSACCWFLIDCTKSLDRDNDSPISKEKTGLGGVTVEFLRMLLPVIGVVAGAVVPIARAIPKLEVLEGSQWWAAFGYAALEFVSFAAIAGLAGWTIGFVINRRFGQR